MVDPRAGRFSQGFAAGGNLVQGKFEQEQAAIKQQQDQQNLRREQAVASVAEGLELLQTSAKNQSSAYFTSKGNNDQKGMDTAIAVQTRLAQDLWKSTDEMLKSVGMSEAEIANIKTRFRMGASLNNPAAEQKLIAAGEAEAKVQPAIDTAAGKGRVEQQQVQTSDITSYLNTKTNDIVRGYVKNGRSFNAVTNEELSANYIPTKSLSGVEGGIGSDPFKDSAFLEKYEEAAGKEFVTSMKDTEQTITNIDASSRDLNTLNEGIISGFGGNFRLGLAKALNLVGKNNDELIARSESYYASRARAVAQIIKDFGSGTGLSDADREYAEKAAAGSIPLTQESMKRILVLNDVYSRIKIKQHNDKVSPAMAKAIERKGLRSPYFEQPSANDFIMMKMAERIKTMKAEPEEIELFNEIAPRWKARKLQSMGQ